MAKYQCNKGHIFNHPAKTIEHFKAKPYTGTFVILGNSPMATDQKIDIETDWVENSFEVCPFCGQREFKEFVEPATDIESVYIYELTTGPQTELNRLLNEEGYKITNRYAKQYHLEKPKTPTEKDYITEAQIKAAEAKTP